MELNKNELHYLGGLFDGEGHIAVSVHKNDDFRLGYHITPRLEISMNEQDGNDKTKAIVRRFKDMVSPDVSLAELTFKGSRSPQWRLQFGAGSAVKGLEILEPYLILKRDDARKILNIDWDQTSNEAEFISAMEMRDEIRESSSRESKYSADYFRKEFGRLE